jgi:thioester reductase-like protein
MRSDAVLFTGFPGFIGVRLLPRLLDLTPRAAFLCLVQERFVESARTAIAEIEAARPEARGRLEIVVGDITLSGLGLEGGAARTVHERLVAAYHLAAVYDLAVARDLGMRVNVEGTRNVLRFLADSRRLSRLHYVSTCYVSGTATGVFRETDLDVGQGFKNSYEETKFLAEGEVVKSGLPFTVYRPSIVVGDSRTGETGKFDGPYFTLTAMEKVPSHTAFVRVGTGKNPANLVPVDYVVEGMARLSTASEKAGLTYALADPDPLTVFEVSRLFARELNKSFVYLPVPKSVAKAAFSPRFVQRFFGMPAATIDYFDHPCRYDATQAVRDLGALGIRCPRLPEYVGRLVDFYRAHKGAVRRAAMV